MNNPSQNIIIYNTADGKTSVSLLAKNGTVWMNQMQISELFATSIPNISMHITNIFKENELDKNSVVKDYLTTVSDGKNYNVSHYSLEMILAIIEKNNTNKYFNYNFDTIKLNLKRNPMIKRTLALFFLLLLLPVSVWGNEFEEGVVEYKKGQYHIALNLFNLSCKEGNKQGCYNLAVMYKHGQGIRPSRQKAKELFSMACQDNLKECHFNSLNNES